MDASASEELLDRARQGDQAAYETLVEPHRHELQVHCYRMLASVQDAEDVLQEVLLAAWRGLAAFEGRASLRTWLYRIATNRCLNHLRADRRRPPVDQPTPPVALPEPTRHGEVFWLEPYPDLGLERLVDPAPGPEARYACAEAVSLAFTVALQRLTPSQRAALVLRDVLGFSAKESADILDASVDSVNGSLKRARAAMDHEHAPGAEPPLPAGSPAERDLVARFTDAFCANDVESMVSLLTADVWLSMPPLPVEYQGPELFRRFYATVVFRAGREFHAVPTRANGQPAVAAYLRDQHSPIARAHSLVVLETRGPRISAVTRFDPAVLPRFGLPRTIDVEV